MAVPVRPLVASVDIAAPPDDVWRVVADVRRTREWSPECRRVFAPAQVTVGSRFVGINKRGLIIWPTNAKVIRCKAPSVLAYRIVENGATWSYELEPVAGGTRLTERREADGGITAFSAAFTRVLLGGEAHTDELEEGIRRSLEAIKVIVESGVARPARTW